MIKKILTLGFILSLNIINAQINLNFNTHQLPENWTTQGSFGLQEAAIYPKCENKTLVATIINPSSEYWIQSDVYTYNGRDVDISMLYGVKDLYHSLGVVNQSFDKPQIFFEYAEGNSDVWIEYQEINLDEVNQSESCLVYESIISAELLAGYQTIKYRIRYNSPAQTGQLYLLYWSIDKLKIKEKQQCEVSAPTGEGTQTLADGSRLSDIIITGENIIWYSDIELTEVLDNNTVIEDGVTYFATQTIGECESETSLAVMVNIESLSVDKFDELNLKIYPNPVKDILNISSLENISEIQLFNIYGQKILTNTDNSNLVKIDLSTVSPGSYILKIKIQNTLKSVKILVK